MNLLIFEYEHMAIEDLREALTNLGHTYTVITDENIYNHVDEAFDARFDKLIESASYDAVFTFNYFPVISNCCKKHNIHIPLSIPAITYFYLTSRLIWSLKKKISKLFIICRLPSIPAGWIR